MNEPIKPRNPEVENNDPKTEGQTETSQDEATNTEAVQAPDESAGKGAEGEESPAPTPLN